MKKIILLFVILYNSLRVGIFENSASMKKRSKSRHAIRDRNRREMERVCRSTDLRGDAEVSRLDRIKRDATKASGDVAGTKMESGPETSTTGDESSDENSDSISIGESSVSSKSSSSSLASTLSSLSALGRKATKKIGKAGKDMQRKLGKSLGNISSAGRGSYTVQHDSDVITSGPDSSDGEEKEDKKMKKKMSTIKLKKAGNKILQRLSDSISSLKFEGLDEKEEDLKEKIKEGKKKKKKKKGLFSKLGKSLTNLNPFSSKNTSKTDQEAKGQGEEKKKVKKGKKRGDKSLGSATELSQSAPEIGQGDIDEADKMGKKRRGLFGRLSKSTGDMTASKGANIDDSESKKGKGQGFKKLKQIFKKERGKGGSSDLVSVPMSKRGNVDSHFMELSEDTGSTSSVDSDVDIGSLYAKVDLSKKRGRQEGGSNNQILVSADVHREGGGFGEDSDSEGPSLLHMAPQLPEEPVQDPSPLPIQIPDLVGNTHTGDASSVQGGDRRETDSGSDSDSDSEASRKDSFPGKLHRLRSQKQNSYPLKHYSSKIKIDKSNSNRFKVTPKGDKKSGDEAKPSQKPPLKPKPLLTKNIGRDHFDKKAFSTPPPPPTSPPPEDDDSSPSSPETKVTDPSVSAPPPPPTSPPPEDDDSSPSSPETKGSDPSVSSAAPLPPAPPLPPSSFLKGPLKASYGKKHRPNSMPELQTGPPFNLTPKELQAKLSSLRKVGENGPNSIRRYSRTFPGASKGTSSQSELLNLLMKKIDERRKRIDAKDDNGESDDEWS
ncbi:hypothetical protein OJ253_2010 [Cryptosporidium canis]|uniref:WH2 domain-containing protein n=1 Tax=Cryptosporidium canis TaxID=195482 RepID=A0A9D5DIY8_9CRYT|nr:hypothetical protein OJ253_2010 [Cryptosporidium canis]